MADTILTITQVENFFWSMTLQILGLDPLAVANQSRVRIGWPEYGAPAWQVNDNIIFLLITQDEDSLTQQMETTYAAIDSSNIDTQTNYTRVHRVNWVCYGPTSYGDADTIRSNLTVDAYKQLMSASNLYRVPSPIVPFRSPELFNGQWWEKTSYFCKFNEFVQKHSTTPLIANASTTINTN
jgi:hypothetical protein